jgi:uncharacterized protein (DUF1697 family)
MADLRALVRDIGYTEVRTLLNSGNVVFTDRSPEPTVSANRIEEGLDSRLGVSARVTVLTASELDEIVHGNPLLDVGHNLSRLLVAVLATPADRVSLEPLLQRDWAPESLALGARVAYLWCPDGVLASSLPSEIERAVGDSVTTRTWATTMRIHAAVRL